MLTGHEHPDGDCIGAQVGLYHLLQNLGAEVRICNPDPVARSLRFLLRHTPIEDYPQLGSIPEADVVVLLDCAVLSRLGDMAAKIRDSGAQIAVIDHHVGSENGDSTIHLVDVTAAATGVLVYDLYKALDVEISIAAAEGVFVSVVSDTGWFRYSNTDPSVMAIAKEMIERGVAPDKLYDRMFRANDPTFVALLAESLATHEFRIDGKLAFAVLERDLVSRIHRSGFDTDQVLEPIRSVEGVQVAALFRELADGSVKLSLRAMGDIDVQAIAAGFGGGGHVKASGATMRMALPDAVSAVEERVREALGER